MTIEELLKGAPDCEDCGKDWCGAKRFPSPFQYPTYATDPEKYPVTCSACLRKMKQAKEKSCAST